MARPYSKLKLDRCDANGNIQPDGTYIYISFDWNLPGVDSITVGYKEVGSNDDFSLTNVQFTGESGSVEEYLGNGTINQNQSYLIHLRLSSETHPGFIGDFILPVAFYTMNVSADGKSVGFGQKAPPTTNPSGLVSFAGDVKGLFVKLWENPSPSSPFAPDYITTLQNSGLTDSMAFLLVILGADTSGVRENTVIIPLIPGSYTTFMSTGDFSVYRRITYVLEGVPTPTLYFEQGWRQNGTGTWAKDDTAQIPVAIYGIKGGS